MLNPNISYNLGVGVRSLTNKGNNVNELGGVKDVKPGDTPDIKTSAVWKGHIINGKIMINGKPKLEKGDICILDDGQVYRYNGKNNWEPITRDYQTSTILNALETGRGDIRRSME